MHGARGQTCNGFISGLPSQTAVFYRNTACETREKAFVKISTEYKDPFGYLESGRNELALSDRCEAGQAWPTYLERPIVFLRTDGGREADASEEYANQRRRRVLLPVTVLPTPSTFPAQAQPAASCCRCRPPGDPKVPLPPVSRIRPVFTSA
jgi:hypothetical protein